ncbi:MAG: ChaN family lipoprotein [Acidobacteriota bacterium]
MLTGGGVLLLSLTWLSAMQDDVLHLPVGDPGRKGQRSTVVLDAIIETSTGELLTPRGLALRLSDSNLVLVGESHTNPEFHRVQRTLIDEISKTGRHVLIGLEMFPCTEQSYLDDWVNGLLTEQGFVKLSNWYRHWGYNWNYYRDIFLLARERQLPLFAINTPRSVVAAVRKKGFENLTEEEVAHLPAEVDTASPDHLRLFRAFFSDKDSFHASLGEEQWRLMFEAQCTWDATMAFNAVRQLQGLEDEKAIMIVLAGLGHVAYGLGIQRQAAHWFKGKMVSVIPVSVKGEEGEQVESTQSSYADFIWGLPPVEYPPFPELGLSASPEVQPPQVKVIFVQEESVAEAAGFQVGDILVSMDGIPITDRSVVNRLVAGKRWGDSAGMVVRRGEAEITLEIYFRRPSNH